MTDTMTTITTIPEMIGKQVEVYHKALIARTPLSGIKARLEKELRAECLRRMDGKCYSFRRGDAHLDFVKTSRFCVDQKAIPTEIKDSCKAVGKTTYLLGCDDESHEFIGMAQIPDEDDFEEDEPLEEQGISDDEFEKLVCDFFEIKTKWTKYNKVCLDSKKGILEYMDKEGLTQIDYNGYFLKKVVKCCVRVVTSKLPLPVVEKYRVMRTCHTLNVQSATILQQIEAEQLEKKKQTPVKLRKMLPISESDYTEKYLKS